MRFIVNRRKLFDKLDALLELFERKLYPFNRPDAIVPQKILPLEMRESAPTSILTGQGVELFHPGTLDKRYTLACFYFYVCIYMRGGIESLQAFNAMIKLWRKYPELFNPFYVQNLTVEKLQPILKKFVGWDSEKAAYNWIENSKRLVLHWGGNPLNLIKGLRTWEEACRRIRNKRTSRDKREAGIDGQGFEGFQYKMVSMLLYFYDWEEWFEVKFVYPSPADFQNFRFGFSLELIVAVLDGHDQSMLEYNPGGVVVITVSEKVSEPWRNAIMAYIRSRKADPVKVADAIWLFPLILCGNSPATMTKAEPLKKLREKDERLGMLEGKLLEPYQLHFNGAQGFVEDWKHDGWVMARSRRALQQTCYTCPFLSDCKFSIPAKPYYSKETEYGRSGKIVLREQPLRKGGSALKPLPPPRPAEVEVDPDVQHILELAHLVPPAPAPA